MPQVPIILARNRNYQWKISLNYSKVKKYFKVYIKIIFNYKFMLYIGYDDNGDNGGEDRQEEVDNINDRFYTGSGRNRANNDGDNLQIDPDDYYE